MRDPLARAPCCDLRHSAASSPWCEPNRLLETATGQRSACGIGAGWHELTVDLRAHGTSCETDPGVRPRYPENPQVDYPRRSTDARWLLGIGVGGGSRRR